MNATDQRHARHIAATPEYDRLPPSAGGDGALLSVSLLGGFSVTPITGDAEVPPPARSADAGSRATDGFPTRKTALLFAYLLCFPARRPTRDALAELFWPDQDPGSGRRNLRQTLLRLRRHLASLCPDGEEIVDAISDRDTLALRPSRLASNDKERVEQLISRAEAAQVPADVFTAARAASDLYAGALLEGYDDLWILAERERLQERYVGVLRRALRLAFEQEDLDLAINVAHRILAADPSREGSHRDMIRLLLRQGRTTAAYRQLQELERVLGEQGLGLSARTRELAAQLRAAYTPDSGATPSVAEHSAPRMPLGSHADASPIPAALTRFFGRDEDQRELLDRLIGAAQPSAAPHPSSRLLTLIGPGGNGKTRLAREVAMALHTDPQSPFAGSTAWLTLSDVSDSESVLTQLAALAQMRSRTPLAGIGRPSLEVFTTVLQEAHLQTGKWTLLVLDNAEAFLIEGARLVRSLLERVPFLVCLVTSRIRLGLPGEQEVLVDPLPVPPLSEKETDTAALAQYPAVQLFVDRAQLVQRRFRLTTQNAGSVAALCAHLDGSPLAIELAAPWIRSLSPEQIAERLLAHRFDVLVSQDQEAPERHRSLRAVIEGTESLLLPGPRRLFHLLSVFRGTFSLEAAEAVCGADVSAGSGDGADGRPFLTHLSDLTASSIVTTITIDGRPRYQLPETLREWGLAQLRPRERLALRRRFAAHWTTDAQGGPGQAPYAIPFAGEPELDNLRATSDFLLESEEEEDVLAGLILTSKLSLAASWGYVEEARQRIDRHLQRARRFFGHRATIPSGFADPFVGTLHMAAAWARYQGDMPAAERLYKEGMQVAEEHADVHRDRRIGLYLGCSGLLVSHGDQERAEFYSNTAFRLCRELDAEISVSHVLLLVNQGAAFSRTGALDEARDVLGRALNVQRDLEAVNGPAYAKFKGPPLLGLAHVEIDLGDLSPARRHLREAVRIFTHAGWQQGVWRALRAEGDWYAAAGEYETAVLVYRRLVGDFKRFRELETVRSTIEGLSRVSLRQQQFRYAARLLGAADALGAIAKIRRTSYEDGVIAAERDTIREAIGAEIAREEHAHGSELSIPDIVALTMTPPLFDEDVT